ncbi:MAG: carboxypeptidase-like regulatory domain-containing protein [Armatimonadota bacterium]
MAFSFRSGILVLVAALVVTERLPAMAVDLMTGGVVVDAQSGSLVSGATVAVFNDKGEVVGTDITDSDGAWQLNTGWKEAHLKAPPSGGGLFSSMFGVLMWPVRTTARVVGRPAKNVLKGAARAAGGAAVAGAGAAAVAGGGPVAIAAAGHVGRTIGQAAAGSVVGMPNPDGTGYNQRKSSNLGQVRIRVWKQGHKDYNGTTRVYSLDRVEDEEKKDYHVATVDPVKLAGQPSTIESSAPSEFGIFRNVSSDPVIVLSGVSVRLRAEITLPREIDSSVIVTAWDLTSKKNVQLMRSTGDFWEGMLEIPQKTPFRNHDISIVAYRIPLINGQRDHKLENGLWDKGAWDIKKPFPVDPAILACRNRGYTVITVTKPEKTK